MLDGDPNITWKEKYFGFFQLYALMISYRNWIGHLLETF